MSRQIQPASFGSSKVKIVPSAVAGVGSLRRIAWLLMLGVALANADSGLRDSGKVLSESTTTSVKSMVDRLSKQYRTDVLVVVQDKLPAEQAAAFKKADKAGKDQMVSGLAKEAGRMNSVSGVVIYLVKDAGMLRVVESEANSGQRVQLPKGMQQQIVEAMMPSLRQKNFDAGIQNGLAKLESIWKTTAPKVTVLSSASAGTSKSVAPNSPNPISAPRTNSGQPATGPISSSKTGHSDQKPGAVTPATKPVAVANNEGGSIWGWVILAGVGIIAFMVISALIRAMVGGGGSPMAGRPMPAGYPQAGGFPQPGGGGFFNSMLGGIGGAMLGNWIYDSFAGPRQAYGGESSPAGGDPRRDYGSSDPGYSADGAGDAGGDFGGDSGDAGGDFGGDFGDGGGDFGGDFGTEY